MEKPSFKFQQPAKKGKAPLLTLGATQAARPFIEAGLAARQRGDRASSAPPKKPEEVEKEARARVVSEGGDPGNPTLVLSRHSIQFGQYQGQTFKWLLENDVGWTTDVLARHQKERETSVSQSPLMSNKVHASSILL